MRTVLTLNLPASCIAKLMDGWRRGDPKLLALFQEWGLEAINPHDEDALSQWENEGGRGKLELKPDDPAHPKGLEIAVEGFAG